MIQTDVCHRMHSEGLPLRARERESETRPSFSSLSVPGYPATWGDSSAIAFWSRFPSWFVDIVSHIWTDGEQESSVYLYELRAFALFYRAIMPPAAAHGRASDQSLSLYSLSSSLTLFNFLLIVLLLSCWVSFTCLHVRLWSAPEWESYLHCLTEWDSIELACQGEFCVKKMNGGRVFS